MFGPMLWIRKAGNQLEDYLGRYQPMRIGHIALLKEVRQSAGREQVVLSVTKKCQQLLESLDFEIV